MAKKPKGPTDEDQGHPEPTGEPTPSTPDWDDVAKKVQAKIAQHEHTLKRGGLEIGIFIFDKGFNGDLSKVQDKNPLKGTSLADLAKRGEIGVDSTTLGNWVRSGALYRWFEKNGHPLENLTTSHFIALLPMEDEAKKKELAIMANQSGWSVRGLREQVAVARGISLVNWGKEAMKKMANPKSLLADEKLLKFLADKDLLLRDLSGADRTNLKTEIDTVKQLLERHKSVLDGLLDNLSQIDTDIEAEEAAKAEKKAA